MEPGFDRIVLDGREITAEEFFRLPIGVRMPALLGGRVKFFRAGREVDPVAALESLKRGITKPPKAP